jgi:uncharacterized membrane protein (UPF0127 family)
MRPSGPLCLAAVMLASACSRAPSGGGGERGSGPTTTPTTTTTTTTAAQTGATAATPAGPTATVTLASPSGPVAVTVEVVRSPALLEKGLMYRRFMPADHGMLFLMGEVDDHHFWMRNTLIPLDIVFIASDLTIAGIVADAKPLDLTSRGVDKPSQYVLEVNGGWMAAHGIGAGAKVTFANVEAAAR